MPPIDEEFEGLGGLLSPVSGDSVVGLEGLSIIASELKVRLSLILFFAGEDQLPCPSGSALFEIFEWELVSEETSKP